jgi:hypothetical protein
MKTVKAKKTGEFTLSIGPLLEGRGLSQNPQPGNTIKDMVIESNISFYY